MVGLDIGSKTIKIVELEKNGPAFGLNASGVVGYTGTPVNRITDDKELAAIGQVVKKLHKEAGVTKKEVNISIPESLVFTRSIKFPLLTDAEIASAVKWESEQYIPIPVADAIIQHTILERNEKSSPPEVLVLLVAAPRALVEKYVKIVDYAGLTATSVETELVALSRVLAPVDQTAMLVDFGGISTNIAITKSGNLAFSRSIPIAGEAFSRAVAQTLSVPDLQAEEYKKAYGLSAAELEGKVKGALDPIIRLVVDEIKKAINYYQSEEKGDAPSAIIITGGSSGMRDIVPVLTNTLGLEVSVANPFSKVTLDADTAKNLAPYSQLYSVAVGLSMREE